MKAAFLTGIRQLQILDTPEPKLTNPRDVLLHIDTVGVCGSDVHYYTTGRIGTQVVQFPERVGHECAGTVVEVGSEVSPRVVSSDVVPISSVVKPMTPSGEANPSNFKVNRGPRIQA